MTSTKLERLKHVGITLAVGIPLAVLFLMDEKPDLPSRARNLIPEEITADSMISADFGEESGAALFSIKGHVPKVMQSFEVLPGIGSRGPAIRAVNWTNTAPMRVYSQPNYQNCSCFACARDVQICKIASEWLNKEGSLLYLDSNPQGTSYILNHDDRQIIVIWNRRL
tara:strand:+ start:492 stop:995 length:504 start_codon:yes stop_codon:yes gene_type:complete